MYFKLQTKLIYDKKIKQSTKQNCFIYLIKIIKTYFQKSWTFIKLEIQFTNKYLLKGIFGIKKHKQVTKESR